MVDNLPEVEKLLAPEVGQRLPGFVCAGLYKVCKLLQPGQLVLHIQLEKELPLELIPYNMKRLEL